MEDDKAAEANGERFDFISLLSGTGRDFLVRNTGEKVKIDTLEGKKLGLYFSGSWCGPCQQFTPNLIEVYNELSSKGDFEIILVSADTYSEAFDRYFAKMPWLAIPFSDSESRKNLQELFAIIFKGIPHLVILDEKGKVLTENGVLIIQEFGAEGYPFTAERIKEMQEQEEEAKKNQSLKYILVTPSRDFVISNDEKKVPVSELEGKMVGLYFFYPSHDLCSKFTPKLMEIYNKVKEISESFEIVMLCVDDDEELFRESLRSTPWFALPFTDNRWQKLVRYFELQSVPSLVIIGSDGKTLNSNAVEAIEDYGIQAYPFTPEKIAELAEIEKAEVEKAGWPQKVKHELHNEHELVLTWRRSFICAGCKEEGHKWSFYCEECEFDLHPKCALKEENGTMRDMQQEKEFGEETEEQEEAATKEQSLRSILVSPSRDFVLSNDKKKVPVSELEGKMVGLYFYHPDNYPCLEFTPILVEVYKKLKEMGERFEIVMVNLEDGDEESFNESFCADMPWFTLPFNDSCEKLVDQFKIKSLPTLVIIGPDGKMLHSNVTEAIEEHGIQAYPFTPEKFAELEEREKARNAAQTLESILVSGNLDFVIGKDEAKVPVSDLVGKNIFLYFSAHWCPVCCNFLPKFIKAYHEIKAKDNSFEVIFVSYDRNEASFKAFFSGMPWLALPFGDKRREYLTRYFKVRGIPMAVAIGRTGKTITTEVVPLIEVLGGDAYSIILKYGSKDEEELDKSVKRDEKELEKKVNEDEKGLEQTVNKGEPELEKRVKKDKEELKKMMNADEDEGLDKMVEELKKMMNADEDEGLDKMVNKDKEELEKTVKKDDEKLEINVYKDEEVEGTMMNKLLSKLRSLIQTIVEFLKKLGFLS